LISVKGAKQVAAVVLDEAGKVVKVEKFDGSQATLKGLLPGTYKVALASVDMNGRQGPLSPARELKVPDTSDVKAPGFKKLKIK
jgi:hypothetical protein